MIVRRIGSILTICFLLCIKVDFAQNEFLVKDYPAHIKFDEDYVRELLTDSSGVLWMRTFSRIYRYDGNQFESMDNLITPDFKLKDAYMLGSAMLLNYNNEVLKFFDFELLKLINISFPSQITDVSHIDFLDQNHIFITSRQQRRVFVCSLVGFRLQLDKVIENLQPDFLIPIDHVMLMYSKNDSLYCYSFVYKTSELLLCNTYLEDWKVKDSVLYMNSITGFFRYDIKYQKMLDKIATPNGEDGHNVSICNGKIWLFTNSNSYIFNEENNDFDLVSFQLSGVRSIFHRQSFNIIYNKSGDYYILSNFSGLYKLIQNQSNEFCNYNLSSKIQNTKDISIRCIYYNPAKANIYVSLNNLGLYSFYIKGKSISRMEVLEVDKMKNRQSSFLNKICVDQKSRLWLCSNLGFKILDKELIYESFLNKIWDVIYLKGYNWVIGNSLHSSFVHCYNDQGELLKSFEYPNQGREQNSFWDIEPYSNYLLISSVNGLIAFDVITEKFVSTSEILKSSYEFKGRTWSSKILGKSLYIASQDEGLRKVNLETGKMSIPIPGINKAFQLESNDGKNLWVNLQDKIVLLKDDGSFFVIKSYDFPLPLRISFHGMYLDDNDNLWVCGIDGFTSINTKLLTSKLSKISVKSSISNLSINEKLISAYVPSNSLIELPHDSNNISITIANSLLDIAEDLKIKYQLLGYDALGAETDNTNKITYKNLPYGDYLLQVIVRNSLGIWDAVPTKLYVNIQPPWYLTVAAKITYAILVLLAFISFYLLLKRQFEKQQQQEFLLMESELRAIKSQLNPHFIFNSLNSIQSHIISDKTQIASRYLNKFAKLLRRALDYSALETISLKQEIEWMESYLELEAMRFDKKFEWKISCDQGIDQAMQIPALVIQPLLENAIIHGLFPKSSEGSLFIQYKLLPELKLLECTITDNGVGRKKNNKAENPFESAHQSKGMLLTGQRLEYLGLKFRVHASLTYDDILMPDGSAGGTTVKIRVPYILNKEFFS